MHAGEVDIDAALVRRLLAARFPRWADLPIEQVPSAGTDNAIYRLGEDKAVRLPRVERVVGQVEKEHRWLPELALHLPLAIPIPIAKGSPAEGYPWPWSVYPWLEGENPTLERLTDPRQAATDLAGFIGALHRIDPTGGPLPGTHNFLRGVPLAERDRHVRLALAALNGPLDVGPATAAWEAALATPTWSAPPVWIHGDIAPGNLLAVGGRLSAVIDWGGLALGDPACDLIVGWTLFSGESRGAFRTALEIDDATWARGRGWALLWALLFIPYYLHTNPVGVALARRTLDDVLADRAA